MNTTLPFRSILRSAVTLGCAAGLMLASGSASAAYYENFQADFCRGENSQGQGVRQYSAILWGIPWGYSWEQACYETPGTAGGQSFSAADRCVNTGVAMWGEVDVVDPTCQVDRSAVEAEIGMLMGEDYTCDFSLWASDGCSNPLVDDTSKAYRGQFNAACVFHDYCYASPWGETYGRTACDQRFTELMFETCDIYDEVCIGAATAYSLAVNVFGHEAYVNGQNAVNSGWVTCEAS